MTIPLPSMTASGLCVIIPSHIADPVNQIISKSNNALTLF